MEEPVAAVHTQQQAEALVLDSISEGASEYLWQQHRRAYIWSLIGGITGVIVLCALYFPLGLGDYGGLFFFLLILCFAPAIALNMRAYKRGEHDFMAQMAKMLGYTYEDAGDTRTVAGAFFGLGHSQQLFDVMSGMYNNRPARIFNYRYTEGYGKNAHTFIFTVFELKYEQPLPHVIMNVPDLFAPADVELVELEGDFNSFFKLYVLKGHQMEIREIMQPDVMQELVSSFKDFSMEIIANTVYVIRKGMMTTREDYAAISKSVDHLFDTIVPGLRAASDNQAAPAVVQPPQPAVAPEVAPVASSTPPVAAVEPPASSATPVQPVPPQASTAA